MEYQEARRLNTEIRKLIGQYRQSLESVRKTIRQWAYSDPVRETYADLLGDDVIAAPTATDDEIEKLRSVRYAAHVPPGYKDQNKADGGTGDLTVWLTVLQLGTERQQDVILVSGDQKSDWFVQSDGPLFPRPELLAEFYQASSGKFLEIIKLSELLERYGAEPEVVRDIKQAEARAESNEDAYRFEYRCVNAVRNWLLSHQPDVLSMARRGHDADYEIELPDGRKQVALIRSIQTPANARKRVIIALNTAQLLAAAGTYDKILVFILSEDMLLLTSLTESFGRQHGLGKRIALRIGFLLADGLIDFSPPLGCEIDAALHSSASNDS